FNLPFDLSRLARRVASARTFGAAMKGGFSFELSSLESRPHIRVKHLSRRASFINFASPGKQKSARSGRQRGKKNPIERGYFLDLATLGAALTGSTQALNSLADLLETPHRKSSITDFGRPIDRELIEYAVSDAAVTRECLEGLLRRYADHAETGRDPHKIY